ncbi:hypothetical protein BG000_002395 [Podila horticola]|nr:hypothetical protein BG000_002395 [Podila horticola]
MIPATNKRRRIIEEVEEEEPVEDGVEDDEWEDEKEIGEDEEEENEEELVEGSEGYEKKLKTRDDRRFGTWLARKLNERAIYTVLQARNSGTTKKTPKSRVYRSIMVTFNTNPPDDIITFKKVTELQVKNKVDSIRKAFRKAHALLNKSGFGSRDGEGGKKRVKKKCRHYFDMKENWAVAWTSDVPLYTDSLKNMDDEVIMDDMPRRIHNDKQRVLEPTRDQNVGDNPHDHTQDADDWQSDGGLDEDLETHSSNNLTGPSRSAITMTGAAVTSRTTTSGPSRSATPGPSRFATPDPTRFTPAVSQPLSNNTTSNNASITANGVGGHKDFAQLFLQRMEGEKRTQAEKLTLKREQFDFLKQDTESKNQIELKRLELEAKKVEMESRKLELENQRLLVQQKLDHELQLAQLKANMHMQSHTVTLNAELRNRGREPVPFTTIETTPPPTTSPRKSCSPSHSQ